MAWLALLGRRLGNSEVAASYDRIAENYDDSWLRHLRPVTDEFLDSLPEPAQPTGLPVIDLGCGTGHTTTILSKRHPDRQVIGVDISKGMLDAAGRKTAGHSNVSYVQADMLKHLRSLPGHSAGAIISAWAIGHSAPVEIIEEASRALAPGGALAFVVNRSDALAPLLQAYLATLRKFASEARLAILPRFPRTLDELKEFMDANGFVLSRSSEGSFPIPRPPEGYSLTSLLDTGVMAGLDTVIPITSPGPVRDFLEKQIAKIDHLEHAYIMAAGVRS